MPTYEWNSKHGAFTKQCPVCETIYVGKDTEAASLIIFHEHFNIDATNRSDDGLRYSCKKCTRLMALRNRFKVEVEHLVAMLANQNGECNICHDPISFEAPHRSEQKAVIDHDKNTGQIRGILCSNCNVGMGLFRHDTTILQSVIEYLERPREKTQTIKKDD